MSGRIAARDSIRRAARTEAQRHMAVRRATVIGVAPVVVDIHSYSETASAANDLTLSQWAQLYDRVAGIEVDDMVLVQQEAADWVLLDVVSGKNAAAMFDKWRTA